MNNCSQISGLVTDAYKEMDAALPPGVLRAEALLALDESSGAADFE